MLYHFIVMLSLSLAAIVQGNKDIHDPNYGVKQYARCYIEYVTFLTSRVLVILLLESGVPS